MSAVRNILLTLSLLVVQFCAQGQEVTDKQFIHVDKLLSQNTVKCILQDKKGFFWIGTRSGLNKFDGVDIKLFDNNKGDNSFANIFVSEIIEDNQGDIWIATYGDGVFRYDEYSNSFDQLAHDPNNSNSLSNNKVKTLYQDKDGIYWFGTEDGGLNRYDKATGVFTRYKHNSHDPLSISSNEITHIIEDENDNLWVATWKGGLNLFDRQASRFIHYKEKPGEPNGLSSNDVNLLFLGANGSLWVATQNGLDNLTYNSEGEFTIVQEDLTVAGNHKVPNVILSVMEVGEELWVGTENEGLVVKNKTTGVNKRYVRDIKDEFSIGSNSVWSLYQDNTGIVWIGTFNKGLYKIDPEHRKFQHIKQEAYNSFSISDNAISSFVEDEMGNFWIGTDGGGLNYWDRSNNTFKKYKNNPQDPWSLKSDAVLSLYLQENGDLWVGTWQGGVNILKKGSNRFESFDLGIASDTESFEGNIFAFFEDNKGRLWIASFRNGLFVYDLKAKTLVKVEQDKNNPRSLNSNLVRNILQDKHGVIWVGTEAGGLNKCMEQNGQFYFQHFQHDPTDSLSISNNIVVSMMEGAGDLIWVGTSGGLNKFNSKTQQFQKIGRTEGLPNEVINGILPGDGEEIWISTNKGLSRWNTKTGSFRNYDESDGVQSLEFAKNAFYKSKGGELLFGGVNGFNIFKPSEIKDSKYAPPVYITDFKLNNISVQPGPDSPLKQNITSTQKIELEHDQSDISFEFAILSFSRPEKSIYAYQLVNYDDDWQEIGTRRTAYYTNVPSGYYVFKVKATNSDGVWSEHLAAVEIIISPAWYNTYWAYSIFIIIITGLLVVGIQTIVNRERLQNQIKIDALELSQMQEVNQVKTRFFANISHEFRSPLTLILGPLKSLSENPQFKDQKRQIKMMIRNAQRLLNLINQLLELSKIEAGQMALKAEKNDLILFLKPIIHSFSPLINKKFLSYQVNLSKSLVCYFDKEKVEKIIINLISNAIKYTPEFGKIEICVEQEEGFAVIKVSDNGVGIPSEELDSVFNRYYRVNNKSLKGTNGTGIGLSLTKELVNLHKGEIELESQENEGTSLKVLLPLGSSHLQAEEIINNNAGVKFDEGDYERESMFTMAAEESKEVLPEEKQDAGYPIILVIDDNKEIRDYVCEILSEAYRVIQADNGNDGLEMAKESIPDLIISDIMMPGLDGYELCRKVKTEVKTSHIPVILLTAKASNDSTLTGFEMGADYFIVKPFNPKILLLRVRNVLIARDRVKDNIMTDKTISLDPKNVKINDKDENFLKKAIEVVEENMSNSNFYVDDLGRELGLSRMQLYRKLKGLIGQSANEFTRSIRLKRAAQLIEQNKLTISEITYEVGFSDLQYFRDCFKKQYGVNPTEYLKNSLKMGD